jgi:hypothetical protein
MAQPEGKAMGVTSDYSAHNEPEILDADMTPRDVIEALSRLRFQHGSCAISIDKQIRDYLVTAVSALRPKKPNARPF